MALWRRLLNGIAGKGPWRIAPFVHIEESRTNDRAGVHRAEDFTGVLHSEPGEPALYRAGTSLLGQEPRWETLPDGPRYRTEGLTPATPKTLYALTDAGVITPDGIVYCRRTRRTVAETIRQWTAPAIAHPVLGAVGYPAPQPLAGLTLNLCTLSGSGFYHFLVEALPRLHLARPWLDQVDHVLANGGPGSFQEQWLVHAGVAREKIAWMDGLCHVACEQVIFTGAPMRDQQPTPWNVRAIRSLFEVPAPTRTDRCIWISRRDAHSRQPAWEEQLLARLPGFERVELAGMSPAEQLALVAEAAVLAGPHGAGLAHALFLRPGARAVELFPKGFRVPIYGRLAGLAGATHAWAEIDFDTPGDLGALAQAIQRFITTPPAPSRATESSS